MIDQEVDATGIFLWDKSSQNWIKRIEPKQIVTLDIVYDSLATAHRQARQALKHVEELNKLIDNTTKQG